ncbi:SMP-30/gluconolactonase/LRE family protein [Alteromonas sp.]|nr:SMP-30/gluconolactonase/LRE family protein [Alteromonas sp.]
MELGESPFWSRRLKKWMWVDISRQIIFQKSEKMLSMSFAEMVSNIFESSSTTLVTGETKLYQFIDNGKVEVQKHLFENTKYRCNDGGVAPSGKYWFGTMEKHPSSPKGKIYSLDVNGNLIDQGADIGIPNTFIWLDESHILISDSLLQKTYKVELLASGLLDWINRKVWLDLSSTRGTPDGGAMDDDGNIWLAVWGDASIHRYSPEGSLLDKIELQALQPTSCAFGGPNMDEMLITTATEGMSEAQINHYPDSGKVLVRKMNVKGKVLPLFDLEV